MNNHVHIIGVPESEDSLARTLSRAHSEYAASLNRARGRNGHLWQNRFYSCPMGPTHLQRAMLYVDLNPVRAGLVTTPWEWLWSSARAHAVEFANDPLMSYGWEEFFGFWDHDYWRKRLRSTVDVHDCEEVRHATRTGEPLGGEEFIKRMELANGRKLRVHSRGRPQKKCV